MCGGAAAMLFAGAAAGAQTPASTPAQPPVANAPAAAAPDAPAPSAAQQFPFPEEDSKTKTLQGDTPAAPAPAAPDAPVPGTSNPAANDAARKYPFPGDTAPAAPADGSGYSSSSDSAPGNPAPGSVPDAPVRKKLQLEDAGSAGHIDTARADKDQQVADFYIKDGNYAGAYLRYKDAVIFDPDNADAHFGLAEMARKKGKTDEAIEQYQASLKLDPKGEHAKEARKALAELGTAVPKK